MGLGPRHDVFTLEVIREALVAAAEEMFVVGKRTSKSPVIYELLDYSCAITDDSGELTCQALGTPLFLGTMPFAVQYCREKLNRQILQEGDILLTNNPYRAGTHTSDVTMVMPIWHGDVIVAHSANKAHWTEIGGKEPGSWSTSATDVFHEGLQIPPIKIVERGQVVETAIDFILANSRAPDEVLGTIMSQIASVRVGAERVHELCQKYGRETVVAATEYMKDQSEQVVLNALGRIPKGTYHATDRIDDDGITDDSYDVQAKVEVGDRTLRVNLSGSAAQALGPINCTWPTLVSGLQIIFLALTEPRVQVNSGAFRPLQIHCPPGTVFTAQPPRPTSVYFEAMNYAAELVWKALAPTVRDRLPAGHFMTPFSHMIVGKHPDTDKVTYLVQVMCGGWGAGHDQDGADAVVPLTSGETNMVSVEITEAKYGVLVDRFEFQPVTGGEGGHRGGRGVVREYRVLSHEGALATVTNGRVKSPPWGVEEGRDGSPNYVEIVHSDGTVSRHGKIASYPLKKGEVLRLVSGTGGGWGHPRDRAEEAVAHDQANDMISPDVAVLYRAGRKVRGSHRD